MTRNRADLGNKIRHGLRAEGNIAVAVADVLLNHRTELEHYGCARPATFQHSTRPGPLRAAHCSQPFHRSADQLEMAAEPAPHGRTAPDRCRGLHLRFRSAIRRGPSAKLMRRTRGTRIGIEVTERTWPDLQLTANYRSSGTCPGDTASDTADCS
jgi:hypothetical protein